MKRLAIVLLIASLSLVSCGKKEVTVQEPPKENIEEKQKSEEEEKKAQEEKKKEEEKKKAEEAKKAEEKKKEEAKKTEENKATETVQEVSLANNNEGTTISVSKLIPNGDYVFSNTVQGDIYTNQSFIRGNGTRFQHIYDDGGKYRYLDVYEVQGEDLVCIYSKKVSDMPGEERIDENKNYLNVKANTYKIALKGPLMVGTRWDNKEIVEVGNGLKMNGRVFNGSYVKVWYSEIINGSKWTGGYTYCEGLGIVRQFTKGSDEGSFIHEQALETYGNR